jgi:hypothetical protein
VADFIGLEDIWSACVVLCSHVCRSVCLSVVSQLEALWVYLTSSYVPSIYSSVGTRFLQLTYNRNNLCPSSNDNVRLRSREIATFSSVSRQPDVRSDEMLKLRSRTVCILNNLFRKKALEEFSSTCNHHEWGHDEWYLMKGDSVIQRVGNGRTLGT